MEKPGKKIALAKFMKHSRINLMFSRLDKFDGPIFEEVYICGVYIWDVNWVTNFGGVYLRGFMEGILTGFYGIEEMIFFGDKIKRT